MFVPLHKPLPTLVLKYINKCFFFRDEEKESLEQNPVIFNTEREIVNYDNDNS